MTAPSFSSFPDLSSFPDSSLGPGPSTQRLPSPQQKEERRSKRDKQLRDKPKHDRHRSDKSSRSLDRHSNDLTPPSTYTLLNDERLKAEEDRSRKEDPLLFYSDRTGDKLNLQYGRLHGGDIPRYYLVEGGTKILGLSNAWTVLYRSNQGVQVAVGSRRRLSSLTDSHSRKLLAAAPTRSLVHSEAKYKYEEIDGFLRLPSRRGRQSDQPYRAITLSKNDDNSDSDSASADRSSDEEDSDDAAAPRLTVHQQTLKSLEQQLTTDPTSISTWLSLISQTLSTIPHTSKNATTARSEIITSILSRALSAHPQNNASKELRLKYLRAGEEVWHESILRSEWEDALLKLGGVEIWMEWLDWRIRKGVRRINGVVEDAVRVLKSLGDSEEDEIGKLRVMWRVAIALQNAGYTERATALFQAQAELTFEVPQLLYGLPLDTLLDSLEEFWESEMPRVGEAGAKGWAAWVSSNRPEYIPPTNRTAPAAVVAGLPAESTDPYIKWWHKETNADRTLRLPTRSTDATGEDNEVVESDPYATILFTDIKPLLLSLRSTRAKNVFRLIFLSFLGLHIPGLSASLSVSTPQHQQQQQPENWDNRWSFTHLTSPAYFASIFPPSTQTQMRVITSDSQAGVLVGREKEYLSGFGPVKQWGLGVVGVLECVVGKEKEKERCGLWTKSEVSMAAGVDEAFVRRVFEQLRYGPEDVQWDCYALAFEAALSVKNALKLSRSFLSVAQDSLPHWSAHARLERLRGRLDDARKVYQTVLLQTASSESPAARPGVSILWWDWAEMEWLAGKPEAALDVVLRSVSSSPSPQVGGGTGGIALLRAKRSLEEMVKGSGDVAWKEREAWVKLRGLLDLLTSSSAAAAALSTFDAYLLNDPALAIEEGSLAHESLTVSSLLMLYHHSTTLRNPTPPELLRERVERAVGVYQSNSVLVGMFLEGEKGRGVWGGVRGFLGEDGVGRETEKDVPRRVEEVWIAGWEKGRWEAEKERTRSGLAAAVQNERTRGSLIIWRMFLEFEIRMGELQKAKKMLYIAIGESPLAKELYLLAFGPLRSVFSARELNGFADAMAERELRMRHDLNEMLEGWVGEEPVAVGWEEEDEGGVDEVEYSARQLTKVKRGGQTAPAGEPPRGVASSSSADTSQPPPYKKRKRGKHGKKSSMAYKVIRDCNRRMEQYQAGIE